MFPSPDAAVRHSQQLEPLLDAQRTIWLTNKIFGGKTASGAYQEFRIQRRILNAGFAQGSTQRRDRVPARRAEPIDINHWSAP